MASYAYAWAEDVWNRVKAKGGRALGAVLISLQIPDEIFISLIADKSLQAQRRWSAIRSQFRNLRRYSFNPSATTEQMLRYFPAHFLLLLDEIQDFYRKRPLTGSKNGIQLSRTESIVPIFQPSSIQTADENRNTEELVNNGKVYSRIKPDREYSQTEFEFEPRNPCACSKERTN